MESSVSHSAQCVHPVDDDFEVSEWDARLRGLSHQQLADRLSWLSWWSPSTFTVVMDYMQFVEDLAADTGTGSGDAAADAAGAGT